MTSENMYHLFLLRLVSTIQVESMKNTCSQCTLSLPPENIRNPCDFLMLSRDRERVHWEQIG